MVGDVQKDARAQSDYFGSVIVDYSRVFAILSLLCVIGAAGVFIYINRSVISRLQKLSDNMRRSWKKSSQERSSSVGGSSM